MPRFTPFSALRFRADLLDDAIAPPYDVLSDGEVDDLRRDSPYNVTHIDVPRASDGDDPYERAALTMQNWIRDGVLVADSEPTFTIYRLRFVDTSGVQRDIAGVLGGLEVVDEGAGGVLPHERVTPKASTDRLELTRATEANLSPIWGLSLSVGLSALLAEPGEPLGSVVVDGVEHSVERVTDPDRLSSIAAAIAADDVLIADGHHRYGVARTYRDERRSADGDARGSAEDTLAFISGLTADQLSVEAIHRLYTDTTEAELLGALDECFAVTETDAPNESTLAEMERDGVLHLVTATGSYRLTPRLGVFDNVRAIDGAWLEAALADTPHSVTYQHGVDNVVHAVSGGDAVAAVLIRPVSVAEIERTAREGVLMPPKSTFFTPKLRTGLVIRSM